MTALSQPQSLRETQENERENAYETDVENGLIANDEGVAILGGMMAVIGVILTVIVTYLVVAALFPTFAGSVADVNENLTNTSITFGDETTDGIKPVFAIVIGLAALIGIVGLLLSVFDRSGL